MQMIILDDDWQFRAVSLHRETSLSRAAVDDLPATVSSGGTSHGLVMITLINGEL